MIRCGVRLACASVGHARPVHWAAAALLSAVAACGGNAPLAADQPTAQAAAAQAPHAFTDADNGSTVRVVKGQAFDVVLGSTYWQFATGTDASVVAPQGAPRFASRRADCVPGAGCGSVMQRFLAVSAGQARIEAARTVCGEAMACRPDQRAFVLTVTVVE